MTADGQKLVACWSRREPPDEHRSPATNRHGRPASSGVSTLERRIGPCLPASNVGWAGADGSWMAGAEQIKGSQLVPSCRGRRDKGALCWPRWETQMERHPPARARAWGIHPLAIAGPKLGRPRLDSQISPVTPPVLPPFLFLPLNTRRSPPLLFARATKRGHPFPEVRGSHALRFFLATDHLTFPSPVPSNSAS